ncbi:MAG: DNA-methyltransferase [Candidatus Thorarchaeota archaeon]
MNVDTDPHNAERTGGQRKRRKYIPHLAEFYFRPTFDWTMDEARRLYEQASSHVGPFEIDTIYFEDCVSGMARMPQGSVDLVIADPPFGIDFDGRSGVYNRDSSLVIEGYGEVSEEYGGFTRSWLQEVARILSPTGSAYIFSGWTNLEAVLTAARIAGLHILNHLVWHYSFGVYTRKKFVTSHYHVLLLVKNEEEYMFNKIENYPQDVWILNRPYHHGRAKNGTKLPVELVQRCIDYSSRPGDLVFDPFMGNGTTAVAAKGSYRHFLGFELNPQLREIIDSAVLKVRPGQFYVPYSERLPSIEELARKYPRAYKEYLQREGLSGTVEEVE